MNIVEDDSCSLCNRTRETILHLFVECTVSKKFWSSVEDWIVRNAACEIKFSSIDILFGRVGPNMNLMNHLLLITKQYIFSRRGSNAGLNLNGIISIFKDTFRIEQYSAKVNMRTDVFYKKWALLYNVLNMQ
jgi:hypothetical protein